jgi:hypothetical protein
MLVLQVSPVKVFASTRTKANLCDTDGYLIPSKAILQPNAAQACLDAVRYFKDKYDVDLYFQDMFRDATEQASIRQHMGKYAALPGFSGHNFGLSFDLHMNRIFAQFRCSQKSYSLKKLRADLVKFGWRHKESAMWHFDFCDIDSTIEKTIELQFQELWDTVISISDVKQVLSMLGYKIPKAMNNIDFETLFARFQEDFGLEKTGKMSKISRRVLIAASMKVQLI